MIFYLIISVGIIAISGASVLIKLCAAPAMVIAAYRLFFASLFFIGVFVFKRTNPLKQFNRHDLVFAVFSGLFLCLHFITWISSLKYTSVASSVVLVATAPVFVGIGSILFLREKLTKLLITGIVFTLLGAFVISSQELNPEPSSLFGNFLALLGAMGAAGYLLIGRDLRARIDTFAYVAVVYSITAVLLIMITIIFNFQLVGYDTEIYLLLFLIAFVPQVIGHTSFNWALQHVSATTVSVLTLGEPIGAPLLAFFILKEKITAIQLVGGILILTGVSFALKSEFSRKN